MPRAKPATARFLGMPLSLHRRLPALLWVLAVLWATASIARAQEEVPFVTSPDNVTLEMLRMAMFGPGIT